MKLNKICSLIFIFGQKFYVKKEVGVFFNQYQKVVKQKKNELINKRKLLKQD